MLDYFLNLNFEILILCICIKVNICMNYELLIKNQIIAIYKNARICCKANSKQYRMNHLLVNINYYSLFYMIRFQI